MWTLSLQCSDWTAGPLRGQFGATGYVAQCSQGSQTVSRKLHYWLKKGVDRVLRRLPLTGQAKPFIGALHWGQPTQTLASSQEEVAQLPTSVVSLLRPKPVESPLVLIDMQHRTSQRLLCCRF